MGKVHAEIDAALQSFIEGQHLFSAWAERKGPQGLVEYQEKHNALSIDGIPALRWVRQPDL